LAGGIAFYLGHIAGDFIWYTLVSFSVSRGRKFLNTRRYRLLIALCASLLCFFAAGFIRSGLSAIAHSGPAS
jgi:arginine exporter protein ArgO